MRLLKLLSAILLTELIGSFGTIFTIPNIPTWYATLTKPALNPPSWVFGPVWTILFLLMGVSLFLVWQARPGTTKRYALVIFFIQLALNVLWSAIFFGWHLLGWAIFEILLLWFAIVATIIACYRVNKVAGYLLVPYLVWVSFAVFLTYSVWRLN